MASITGIDLGTENQLFLAGAAFRLSQKAKADSVVPLRNGAEVETHKGEAAVVVRLPNALSLNQLLVEAHGTAQQGLDILSMENMGHYTVPEAHEEYLLWWRDSGRVRLRLARVAVQPVTMSVTARVIRADGTEDPAAARTLPQWHDAFRYYRLSQTTDDLFESYRNMYLAFEAVLSTIVPINRSEVEKDWLRRSLQAVAANIDLSNFVDAGVPDTIQAIMDEQYTAQRCALQHAKMGRQHLLPGSISERQQVTKALWRLAELVRQLSRRHLGVQSPSGGMTPMGWSMGLEPFKTTLSLAVSEDNTPFDPEQTEVSPAGLPSTTLPTHYIGVVDGVGYEHAFLGQILVPDIVPKVINSIVSFIPDGLVSRGSVEALVVDGVDELEVYWVFALNNTQQPKTRFLL